MYQIKSGEEIVEQLFSLQDRGGRDLALRPEMTPTLARMVAAHPIVAVDLVELNLVDGDG